MRTTAAALLLAFSVVPAMAQWTIQTTPTTADLDTVSAVDASVAWAGGAGGTLLRTRNGGALWEPCAAPKGAATAEIAGVQALDANTAIVMTSGKGARSRLFKTKDGCHTWKEVFANPDATGEFVSIRSVTSDQIFVLGQPVGGMFSLYTSRDGGDTWFAMDDPGLNSTAGETAFSPGNGDMASALVWLYFGTNAATGPAVFSTYANCPSGGSSGACPIAWRRAALGDGAGMKIAAVNGRVSMTISGVATAHLVAVGGNATTGSAFAAYSSDGGKTWQLAKTPPSGYRTAVARAADGAGWIAVGSNGADISTDDGATWAPVPGEQKAENAGWTAFSPPFVVGQHGRIAVFAAPAQ